MTASTRRYIVDLTGTVICWFAGVLYQPLVLENEKRVLDTVLKFPIP